MFLFLHKTGFSGDQLPDKLNNQQIKNRGTAPSLLSKKTDCRETR